MLIIMLTNSNLCYDHHQVFTTVSQYKYKYKYKYISISISISITYFKLFINCNNLVHLNAS